MHSYIDLYFSPEGPSPLEVAERLRTKAGLAFVIGPHDLAFEWQTVEEFRASLHRIHDALQGMGVTYRVETVPEDPAFVEPIPWPPPLHRGHPNHPGY